ncbi:MarR family transcriptional regulator [Pseudoduganella sp. FT26W]|uniref:MarR family transcriptional regulator n=1 Tax=Duganella aquatilis TaxID=2666082 RepID=A0A844CY82_9BURK|nr:MarR family winged helix-turn-helix transcriptional regulator [Duganella aquatilis]MRW84858.1 MarR family transcriptional regulator [Duganella aquatilis]
MSDHLTVPFCNSLALRQAARAVSSMYDRHLTPSGLTNSQFSILTAVHHQPGVDMVTLAQQMVMDRTSLVRAIQPLTRDGYLQQQSDPASPRKLVLSLTAAGQAKYQEAHVYWSAAQAEFEAGIGAPQAATLRRQLAGVSQNR